MGNFGFWFLISVYVNTILILSWFMIGSELQDKLGLQKNEAKIVFVHESDI